MKRTLERELKLDVEPGFRLPRLPGRPLAPADVRLPLLRHARPSPRPSRRHAPVPHREAAAALAGQAAAARGPPRAGAAGLVVPAPVRARTAPPRLHAGPSSAPSPRSARGARGFSCASGGGRSPRSCWTRWRCSTGGRSSGAFARWRSSSSGPATTRSSSASAPCLRAGGRRRRARGRRRCSGRWGSTSPSTPSLRARPPPRSTGSWPRCASCSKPFARTIRAPGSARIRRSCTRCEWPCVACAPSCGRPGRCSRREPINALREELAWLGAALGGQRDLDVMREHLRGELRQLERQDRGAGRALLRRLEKAGRSSREELLAALDSPRYLALLDRIEETISHPPVVDTEVSLADVADARVDRSSERPSRRFPRDRRPTRTSIWSGSRPSALATPRSWLPRRWVTLPNASSTG